MQFITLPHLNKDIRAQLQESAAAPDRISAANAKMLLELVDYLQRLGPTPKAIAILNKHELWVSIAKSRRSIRVWADWPDYGQVRDGLPVMYYRFQIKKWGEELSDDARVTSLIEAARVVLSE